MDVRGKIQKIIQENTKKLGLVENEVFTSIYLSNELGISRNTISQYLNEANKKGNVIKINSRPVYFYHTMELNQLLNTHLTKTVYDSIDEVKNIGKYGFEKLIGHNGSLNEAVNQCKAAISYPSQGLPILLLGPTGTGKSFMASLIYEYAVKHRIIKDDGHFITVNCSEYANNPELLTTNLFGHVKGAYTGAEDSNEGLIALADGGVLFLDEVHCLKAECQEKLFQFMDKGIYHCVGDNKNWYKSNCRLIMATTENPQETLLKTLLRRIPIMVNIPALKDRPLIEKREIIYTMFKRESDRIKQNIYISNIALDALMEYEFKANVGEIENTIKAICAKSFLNNKNGQIEVRFLDIPSYLFETMKSFQVNDSLCDKETMMNIDELAVIKDSSSAIISLYSRILEVFNKWQSEDESVNELVSRVNYLTNNFIDSIFFKQKYHSAHVNSDILLKMIDKIYSIIINKYSLTIPNSKIKIYSKLFLEYVYFKNDARLWNSMNKKEISTLESLISEHYPRAYHIAKEVADNVEINLDIQLDAVVHILLTLSFVDVKNNTRDGVVGLILCHGYSTASSMADTANHLLGEHIFDAIDMELQISIDKIVYLVNCYLKDKAPIQELLLLVDMGSLEEKYEKITPLSDCNTALINHVSTAMVLESGNLIKQGKNIKEIIKNMEDNFDLSTYYLEGTKKKEAILTVCATGFGSAKKISELLIESFPKNINLEIIPYDYRSLITNGSDDVIFSKYDVKLIVGTLDPEIDGVEFVAMENIVTNEKTRPLINLIRKYLSEAELEKFNVNIMKNFTLSNIVNQLTILNPVKVMEDVEDIVSELEVALNTNVSNTSKIGLFVHLSYLIERMILRQEIKDVLGMDELKTKYHEQINIIKETFRDIEYRYSVTIPDAEIIHILNYF